MSRKPIFVATHPRACSTAFERVSTQVPDYMCLPVFIRLAWLISYGEILGIPDVPRYPTMRA
jgi:hypothetical protein